MDCVAVPRLQLGEIEKDRLTVSVTFRVACGEQVEDGDGENVPDALCLERDEETEGVLVDRVLLGVAVAFSSYPGNPLAHKLIVPVSSRLSEIVAGKDELVDSAALRIWPVLEV
eukprot:TRINITY_DN40769_c0_g1_i1.p3 TRINITY_DN40769_c0_g1~~TRINITY_DN40769_c0_g1_i1.p3  ORF type:complete len:114 (-),score=13.18 TRINITY_DN40769_c0_g1_i1:482-823(-)